MAVQTAIGPGSLAAMIGGDYALQDNTVWFEFPVLKTWEDVDALRLRADSPMYKATEGITRQLAMNSRGRYVMGETGLCNGLDVLASLRGTQRLLMDLHDSPAEVAKAVSVIDGLWREVYAWQCDIIAGHGQEGMTSWLPVWCPGRWSTLQSDFAAMISPDHFQEFVVPTLESSMDILDHAIYHLDGPGQIPHLESLLALERLDGIQWMPGAGVPTEGDDRWFPLYERIQAAGKNLVLFCNGAEAKKLLRRLSPAGLYLCVSVSGHAEAEDIIEFNKTLGIHL